MSHPDAAEHLAVMSDVVREVWRLALRWQKHDETEAQAGDIFTAVSPLLAWEDERDVASTVAETPAPAAPR